MVNLQSDGKAIFQVFIGTIIALVFIAVIGDSIFSQTNTLTQGNVTVTGPAINATTDLNGRTLLTVTNILNATSNNTIFGNASVGGVILQTGTGTGGINSVQIFINDTGTAFVGTSIRVAYTYEPEGYLSNSGTRAIALLITIFAALAIMVFVVVVFMKEGSMGKLIGGFK